MQNKNLPKDYKGYSTEELLKVLQMRLAHKSLAGVPREMISAMCDLSREYLLSPIHQHSPRGQAMLKQHHG